MSWETISGIIISVVSSGAIIAFVAKKQENQQ